MTSAHDFSFTSIDGSPLPLSKFRGQPVLLVNTASACGYTPQYQGLQALWTAYHGQGLWVVGVPCNDFGGQEPGSAEEIQTFCTTRYQVTFPMTAKVSILGPDVHPFYRWIGESLGEGAMPRWNFTKYLIGADGQIAGSFAPGIDPQAAELVNAVKETLGH
ncbi:MAG TPA: glutathione peroxidase [Alphaproteobacteria bacterium]|nr:glutathione peroxidase [Alphaproteobacteria bacterium]HAJ46035.1 glutathione peroxidase [Alphaproteobacteria bacterium]